MSKFFYVMIELSFNFAHSEQLVAPWVRQGCVVLAPSFSKHASPFPRMDVVHSKPL